MRNLLQPQGRTKIAQVCQDLDDAAVVGPEELAKDQDGEQLMLGKDFR